MKTSTSFSFKVERGNFTLTHGYERNPMKPEIAIGSATGQTKERFLAEVEAFARRLLAEVEAGRVET